MRACSTVLDACDGFGETLFERRSSVEALESDASDYVRAMKPLSSRCRGDPIALSPSYRHDMSSGRVALECQLASLVRALVEERLAWKLAAHLSCYRALEFEAERSS